jgi:hypothetical protein
MVSNDVLDEELAAAQTALAAARDDDTRFFYNLRVQLITNKLNMLVRSVQEEAISIEEYLDMLRERVRRDKALVGWLIEQHKAGEEGRRCITLIEIRL